MHQIIHLSPVGCFTPARGKTVQKNREVGWVNGVLPGPYVPVRVTRGALVAHRYTYAAPCCRTSLYNWTFIPLSGSLWNDLANPVFNGVGLAGFKLLSCSVPTIVYYFSLSLLSVYRFMLWGWGRRTERVYITHSQHCMPTFLNNNNYNRGGRWIFQNWSEVDLSPASRETTQTKSRLNITRGDRELLQKKIIYILEKNVINKT